METLADVKKFVNEYWDKLEDIKGRKFPSPVPFRWIVFFDTKAKDSLTSSGDF